MTMKLMIYSKRRYSIESFERLLQDFVASANRIVGFTVFEVINTGDIAFQFAVSEEPGTGQEVCVLAWADLDQVETLVNATLAGIKEVGRTANHVNIVALSNSPRVLAAMIVESKSESSSGNVKEAQEQNQDPDVKTKRRTKRKAVSRHRTDSDEGAAA